MLGGTSGELGRIMHLKAIIYVLIVIAIPFTSVYSMLRMVLTAQPCLSKRDIFISLVT